MNSKTVLIITMLVVATFTTIQAVITFTKTQKEIETDKNSEEFNVISYRQLVEKINSGDIILVNTDLQQINAQTRDKSMLKVYLPIPKKDIEYINDYDGNFLKPEISSEIREQLIKALQISFSKVQLLRGMLQISSLNYLCAAEIFKETSLQLLKTDNYNMAKSYLKLAKAAEHAAALNQDKKTCDPQI